MEKLFEIDGVPVYYRDGHDPSFVTTVYPLIAFEFHGFPETPEMHVCGIRDMDKIKSIVGDANVVIDDTSITNINNKK